MQTATALWQQVTGTGVDDAAKGLIVRFEMVAEMDQTRTDEEGRPVFVDKEYIEKRSLNDPFSTIHREVEAQDKRDFPHAYKAFKEGLADPVSGTPLKEWAPIARSQAETLAFRGLRTVEQFAEVSDDGCAHLGHGYLTLRDKARAWLLKAKDASQVTKMTAELAKRDNEIETLKRQNAELLEFMREEKEAREETKRGPGRPRKEATT